MPNLRSKVNKRKSDSFIPNAKAQKTATATDAKPRKSVIVPLTEQLRSLRVDHEALKNENDENLKVIENLKIQVALLVHERSAKNASIVSTDTKESQTQIDKDAEPCNKCSVKDSDDNEQDVQPEIEKKFACYLCKQTFDKRWEIMEHRKDKHASSVKICKYFVNGICHLPADVCWFRHLQKDDMELKSSPQTLQEYNCGFCGKIFKNKNEFMKHRKYEHPKMVPVCRELENGWCKNTSEECWYKHHIEKNDSGFQNTDITEKLFSMMEKFSERLVFIEIKM